MSTENEVREKNAKVAHRLDFGEYGFLKFQEGPRNEVGHNGLFIAEDVLPVLVQHLKNLNGVLPSRETGCPRNLQTPSELRETPHENS